MVSPSLSKTNNYLKSQSTLPLSIRYNVHHFNWIISVVIQESFCAKITYKLSQPVIFNWQQWSSFHSFEWGLVKNQQRVGRKVKIKWDSHENHWLNCLFLNFTFFLNIQQGLFYLFTLLYDHIYLRCKKPSAHITTLIISNYLISQMTWIFLITLSQIIEISSSEWTLCPSILFLFLLHF